MRSLSTARQIYKVGNLRRLRVTITAAVGLEKEVFLYRQMPLRAGETEPTGVCEGVCSAADMETHPTNEPLEGADPPWFRLDHADFLLDSETEMLSAWADLHESLETLLMVLEGLEDVYESEVFEISVG